MDLVKIIDSLKSLGDLPYKKILTIVVSAAFLVIMARFDDVIVAYDNYTQNVHSRRAVEDKVSKYSETDPLSRQLDKEKSQKIDEYLEQYLNQYPPGVRLVLVYRFLPPGTEYAYQGRNMVSIKSRDMSDDQLKTFIGELGITWLPMWSGRENMGAITDGKITYSNHDQIKGEFFTNDGLLEHSSINYNILVEMGVKGIYRYPIVHNRLIVGYIAVYLTDHVTDDNEGQLKQISSFLASRVSSYLQYTQKE